ncbi:MAG: helix-turn-helix domain-containing protein [Candidatus Omnitrophica bacterium]|nr:helix-turn-helix domain-containing protein [Candidatus Omnitrophota bacterium]
MPSGRGHQIMTIREVAGYLGLHYLTIYRLIQQRRIPAARLGGRWRFKRDVLDRWIENDMEGRLRKNWKDSLAE